MTSKKPKTDNSQFVCFVWDGYLKRTTVKFFTATTGPDAEFEKHWSFYGPDLRGKYVRVENCAESFLKLKQELAKKNVPNGFGDLFEMGPSDAGKILREVCNVQKAHSWGKGDESDKAEVSSETTAPNTTVGTTGSAGSGPATDKPATKPKVVVKGKGGGKKTTKQVTSADTTKAEPQEIDKEEEEAEPADVPCVTAPTTAPTATPTPAPVPAEGKPADKGAKPAKAAPSKKKVTKGA